MQKFLGIDVGGTNVKVGVVTAKGQILYNKKFSTRTLRTAESPAGHFLNIVDQLLRRFPEVRYTGIGLPGTLNKFRTHTIELPNIPELNHFPLLQELEARFPAVQFYLENDANAAALGEYHFAATEMPEDYIFITLGTGVGGAAIIDRKIFKGGDGNSMEIGHMISHHGKRLEEIIGKAGILAMAKQMRADFPETAIKFDRSFSSKSLVQGAEENDALGKAVFEKVGLLLGEALVSMIRVLDIKNIIIGGGISASFDYISPMMMEVLTTKLTPYYTEGLHIYPATLGNKAGVLGAASLCFAQAFASIEDPS